MVTRRNSDNRWNAILAWLRMNTPRGDGKLQNEKEGFDHGESFYSRVVI
jgi:hypothetical protein